MFWLSIFGLGLLIILWLKALFDVTRPHPCPPQWELDLGTTPASIDDAWPSLSIVIPARDEAANIEACIRSVFAARWPGELEVILVDDRSTDGTREIAQNFVAMHPNLRILSAPELKPGWLGKPNALDFGASHGTGDWFLFLDADVKVYEEGLILLMSHTIAQGSKMSSAMGRLEVDSFWEAAIQTRIGALIAGGNPLEEVNDPTHDRALAVGQCMLFERACYEAIGGHAAIGKSVLDDVDFAKHAKACHVPYTLFYGPGIFRCRMYRSLSEIWHGWSKNLFPALDYRISATLTIATLIFISSILPFLLLGHKLLFLSLGLPIEMSFFWLELSLCSLIFIVDGVGHANRGYSWYHWWTFPLGMSVIVFLFLNSAWRIRTGRGVKWKGRRVDSPWTG